MNFRETYLRGQNAAMATVDAAIIEDFNCYIHTKAMRSKLGRFFISEPLLRRGIDGDHEFAARIHAIFQKFIPIEARFHWDRQATEYLGYCEEFDDVPQGKVAPTYDVQTFNMESIVGGAVVETCVVKFVRL